MLDKLFSFKDRFTKERQDEIVSFLVRDENFFQANLELIKPEFFETEFNQCISSAAIDLFIKSKTFPDKNAVCNASLNSLRNYSSSKKNGKALEEFKGHQEHLFSLALPQKGILQEEIVDFARNQAFKIAMINSMEDLREGKYERAAGRLNEALNVGTDSINLGVDYFTDLVDRFETPLDTTRNPVPTGIKKLDICMNGGLDGGCLGVFMAPPKFGKTTALVNIGFGALMRGKRVLHYTLEISEKKTAMRYDARISGLTLKEVSRGDRKALGIIAKHWKNFKSELIIKSFPAKTTVAETFMSHINRLRQKTSFIPELIIVDYGDLVRSAGKFTEERHIQASAFEGLRWLGEELQVPVWTATRCNRNAAVKAIISMEDIAESYEKCAIADTIIAICRTPDEQKQGRGRLYIAGSRDLEDRKTIDISVDFSRCLIREM